MDLEKIVQGKQGNLGVVEDGGSLFLKVEVRDKLKLRAADRYPVDSVTAEGNC